MLVDFSILNKMTFLRECNITPNEYEVLIGVIMAQDEEEQNESIYRTELSVPSHIPNTEYLRFIQGLIGKKDVRLCLLSLQEKGIILKSCKIPDPNDNNTGLRPNDILFNKNILKKYIRHSGEMFWELWNAYPQSGIINNREISLRNTFGQGGWSNLDEAASCYGQTIKYDAITHQEILELIEKAKDSDLINMGIIKFIRGEEWRNLKIMLEKTVEINIC